MKTLKFMLAAATAIGLASAYAEPEAGASTTFESLTNGTPVVTGLTDAGGSSGTSYFYYAGNTAEDNESVIVSGTPDIARPTGATGDRSKILQVSTGTDPLLRAFKGFSSGEPLSQAFTQDVYVDTLVQFTVTPYTDTVTPGTDDKLMIYLKESTNEVNDAIEYSTNLVVVGGYCVSDGEFEAREYTITGVEIEPNTWHRLTVKAIANYGALDGYKHPAFQVYVDSEYPCVFAEAAVASAENPGEEETGFVAPFNSGSFAELGDQNIVFSLKCTGEDVAPTLQAVGFAGEGKVDDLMITTADPFFTAVDFTFAGVSGVTAEQTPGTDNWTFTAPEGTVIKSFLVNGNPVAAAVGATSFDWEATDGDAGALVVVAAGKALTAPAHAWYENPAAIALLESLPLEGAGRPSAFHGQGQDEYLGLTYGTNPMQFDLYTVDGTSVPTSVYEVPAANATTPGFRGVAISKALGIAMTLAYGKASTMYAYPLSGGEPIAVTKSADHAFDAGAFSPDGAYFFSNNIEGESSKNYYVKWSVAMTTNSVTLNKVGSIAASGRGRCMAYGRINGRDLVFAMVDDKKVDVIDMTGDTTSSWTATGMITDLPYHSYGTLCVSGLNVSGVDPTLTVATAYNDGASNDVLNVYTLTVPGSGAVTASLTKSFDQTALTAAGFGEPVGYGNTVYVTDDNKTIYFARADQNLYAAQYAVARIGNALYESFKDAVDAADTGDTVTVLADCSVTNGNTGITFTNGINVVNNFTITLDGANYALRIANGTTTPVTWSGTGSLVWLRGSGSPILVGVNEKKASYGINDFCEGSFVLNGGYLTSTDATAKGGNLVKLEAGTFTLNDGTINGGTRGVKADSEGNNATCVLTINGGTIVNTNSAAIAASTAGSGSSTVVVNGGTFTGAITGTGMVTIPGTSTAKFDRDQSAFCESGYETTLSEGWYVVTAVQSTGWVDDYTTVTNQTVAQAYPSLESTALATANAGELTEWAKTNNVDFATAAATIGAAPELYTEAFLLNCEPVAATVADEKDDFVLDISVAADGTITVSLPEDKKYNGRLQMKGSNDLSTWMNVSEASSSYKFYKYELSL